MGKEKSDSVNDSVNLVEHVDKRQINEFESKIDNLKTRVSTSRGGIILTLREIITRESGGGCVHSVGVGPTPGESMGYLETGIICGEVRDTREGRGRASLREMRDIDCAGLDISSSTYCFFPDLFIPVERKLTSRSFFTPSLNFSLEDLKKANKGDVEISSLEFVQRSLFEASRIVPYLSGFDVLVGDREIRNYFRNTDAGRGMCSSKELAKFFDLVKNPKKIDKMVRESLFNERTRASDDLVREVAMLCILDNKVKLIEDDVLNAGVACVKEQDGSSYEDWGRYSASVRKYHFLRDDVGRQKAEVLKILQRAEKVGLKEHIDGISGDCVGFPGQLSSDCYLQYVNDKILPEINGRLKRINNHINEERRKAST